MTKRSAAKGFTHKMLAVAGVCALAAGAVSSPAAAWGANGHRITGALAQKYLSDEAKAAIASIIGGESLAEAATWADDMRSDPSEFWQKTASPWHYITVPDGKHYHEVGAPHEGDALSALDNFTKTLKDPSVSLEDKQLALRFIVHIIGDLHQPLHVGNGTDRGGNDVKVKYFGEDRNLHGVWDTSMIEGEQLSFTEWTSFLDYKITDDVKDSWWDADPMTWVSESAEIRDTIYPKDNDLRWSYKYENLPTVKTRLSMAGVRIAAYLNTVFAGE